MRIHIRASIDSIGNAQANIEACEDGSCPLGHFSEERASAVLGIDRPVGAKIMGVTVREVGL